eukprot:4561895-Prymnesium_polylepis.1
MGLYGSLRVSTRVFGTRRVCVCRAVTGRCWELGTSIHDAPFVSYNVPSAYIIVRSGTALSCGATKAKPSKHCFIYEARADIHRHMAGCICHL